MGIFLHTANSALMYSHFIHLDQHPLNKKYRLPHLSWQPKCCVVRIPSIFVNCGARNMNIALCSTGRSPLSKYLFILFQINLDFCLEIFLNDSAENFLYLQLCLFVHPLSSTDLAITDYSLLQKLQSKCGRNFFSFKNSINSKHQSI